MGYCKRIKWTLFIDIFTQVVVMIFCVKCISLHNQQPRDLTDNPASTERNERTLSTTEEKCNKITWKTCQKLITASISIEHEKNHFYLI